LREGGAQAVDTGFVCRVDPGVEGGDLGVGRGKRNVEDDAHVQGFELVPQAVSFVEVGRRESGFETAVAVFMSPIDHFDFGGRVGAGALSETGGGDAETEFAARVRDGSGARGEREKHGARRGNEEFAAREGSVGHRLEYITMPAGLAAALLSHTR